MKTSVSLSLLAVCLFSSFRSSAQSNFPFPITYAEWSWHTVTPIIGPNDLYYFHKNYLSGDSLFNGKIYNKLYGATLCNCNCSSVNGAYQSNSVQSKYLIGGLREEAGKVYFTGFGRTPFDNFYRPVTDTLLFDFTLNLDDTLLYDGLVLRVTSIDSTAEGRRVIRIKSTKPNGVVKQFSWVEGLGGPFGPLETLFWINDYNYYAGNSCFSQDQPGFCVAPCVLSSGVDDPEDQAFVNIFPSNAQDFITITISENFGPYRLSIYSNEARLIKTFEQTDSICRLSSGELPKGVLHFVFENNSGKRISKTYMR